MKQNLLEKSGNMHLVGIGGIGVSALAGMLLSKGKNLSGSDCEKNALIGNLEKNGVKVSIGHSEKNIPKNAELIIYSLAIAKTNPEIIEAKRRKIPILSYPQAVGELTHKYFLIAICGTHGKSTITALISKTLMENKFDPNVILGTKLRELKNANFRVGKSSLFILEACEYMRAFLNYSPRIIVLHTLDPDHLDYYKNYKNYLDAFRKFILKLPEDGYFFANLDDDDVHLMIQTLQTKKFPLNNVFTYSTKYENSDFYLRGNKIIKKNAALGNLHMQIPGEHNRTNALAAFAVCSALGMTPASILKSLNGYKGSHRRFELKGKIGKTVVIDDYAHHPAEIKATLNACKEKFPKKKICVVFQPHQYSRTKNLLEDFAKSFNDADCVIIPNIYEVRDRPQDIAGMTPERLVAAIKKNKKSGLVLYCGGEKSTLSYIKNHAKNYGVLLTMGAGDVYRIADLALRNL